MRATATDAPARTGRWPDSGASSVAFAPRSDIKMRQGLEFPKPGVDFAGGQTQYSFQAEILDSETGHHRAIHHGPPEVSFRKFGGASQIAHEAAGKAVASPGGIVDLFQRVGGNGKHEVVHKH